MELCMKLSEDEYRRLEEELVKAFRKAFGSSLIALILFGSYARREARPDSDIDVLVVVRDELSDRLKVHELLDRVEEELSKVLAELARKGYHPVLSPHVLTKSQARVFRPLYLDMVFDARVLYDPQGFAKQVIERTWRVLKRLGAERRRLYRGWVVVLKPVDYRFGERIAFEER